MSDAVVREIVDAVNAVVRTADSRDWAGCRACFTPRVEVDHDAGSGGPAILDSGALVALWEEVLGRFAATLHMVTNHQVAVDEDRATCRSYVLGVHTASETRAGNLYLSFGTYEHRLVRIAGTWKVAGIVYRQAYALGNPSLFPH